MNRKTIIFFVLILLSTLSIQAQTDTAKREPVFKVGIFAPLYLDSVFTKNTFKYKQSIPRFIMPALDFVQGALVALDSLQAGPDYINARVFDTKSYTEKVPDLIRKKELDSLNLIIGSVKDDEYFQLANFAFDKNIPFISATYPNDAGITGNPFLVIMNPTLKSHCGAIFSYLLQNHGTDKIYLVRTKGAQEDMVANLIKQANEQDGKPLLPIEILYTDNNVTASFLKSKLDSNRKNILIGGSLDESFAAKLAKASADIYKTYPITLIGMPNWDNFQVLYNKKDLADFPIYYTSPFYIEKNNAFSKNLNAAYFKKYAVKPNDMAYKGYEMLYMFTKLLVKNSGNLMSKINESPVQVFCEYNIRPVRQNNDFGIPDYFENKHLYLIRILNGNSTKAW